MRKIRLLWHLYSLQVLILLATLTAVAWIGSTSLTRFSLEQAASDLASRARLIEHSVKALLEAGDITAVNRFCREIGPRSQTRITVLLPTGEVIGDSSEEPGRMDNHAGRPEIVMALAGQVGSSSRFSSTLGENMMYVAVPLKNDNRLAGVVRTSIPIPSIRQRLHKVSLHLALGGILVALFGAIATLLASRRVSRPLEEMKQVADRFARGDFSRKLHPTGSEEVAGLADSMNHMATQLDERLQTVIRQRNELETLFANMAEGVFAVNPRGRLIWMNQTAAGLLETDKDTVQGRNILRVVENTELRHFIYRALAATAPLEEVLTFSIGSEKRYMQVNSALIQNMDGKAIGALIVTNDITRLRLLENVRREFVANVSHELKTPITSIKGFAETLQDPSLSDPERRGEFLEIIVRQANRLHAIVEDLLSISRIEQEVDNSEVELERTRLKPVLDAVLAACTLRAEDKNISLNLQCGEVLAAPINPPLLEQAVTNLVVNAIKYSDPDSEVRVEADRSNGEIQIKVIDHGCGIGEEHLPRLFERFYRTDKARSRKLGGTGLGLAIVKHIAQAHNGTVTVTSTPGRGSTFTIRLPAVQEQDGSADEKS